MNEESARKGLGLWSRQRPTAAYLVASLFLFVMSTFGADVHAAVQIENRPWEEAAEDFFRAQVPSVGLALQFATFAFAAMLGAALHRKVGAWRTLIFIGPLTTTIVYLHVRGYWLSHEYMHQQMWTAAALSLGFALMKAEALVLVACLSGRWIARGLAYLFPA